MLFDVESDPRELHDLAPDPTYADVLRDMRTRLLAVNESVVRTAHMASDPNGTVAANATKCWAPWRDRIAPWVPTT